MQSYGVAYATPLRNSFNNLVTLEYVAYVVLLILIFCCAYKEMSKLALKEFATYIEKYSDRVVFAKCNIRCYRYGDGCMFAIERWNDKYKEIIEDTLYFDYDFETKNLAIVCTAINKESHCYLL